MKTQISNDSRKSLCRHGRIQRMPRSAATALACLIIVVGAATTSAQTNCVDIHCPSNQIAYACGSNCVPVSFTPLPSASNLCSGTNIPVSTDFPSGYCFPVGITTVTATATTSGQSNQCSFSVTVISNCGPQTPVIFNGIPNSPLGHPIFNLSSNEFLIVNLLTNFPFGALQGVTGLHSATIHLDVLPAAAVGSTLSMRTYGTLNGATNQLITTLTCTNVGGSNIDYFVDFSALGGVANTVVAYNGSNLVATASGVTGAVFRVNGFTLGAGFTPYLTACGQPWAVVDFPTAAAITVTGGPPVTVTRVAVTPEANKLTWPNSPIIVTPHITVDWPHWSPWYKPPFPWPPPPWPDPGDPSPYAVAVGALSRIEIFAQGVPQLRILREDAGMFGFAHQPVGDVTLRGDEDRFSLESPLSGTNHVFGVTWPQAVWPLDEPPVARPNFKVQWQHPNPQDIAGSFLELKMIPIITNPPVSGFVRAVRTATNTVAILADYTSLSSISNRVEIYSGASPVHIEFVVSNVVVGTAFPWPIWFHGPVPLCDPRVCDPPPADITLGFQSNVLFRLASGTNVLGDRIRIVGNPVSPPTFKFDSFSLLLGGGITNLTIIREEELPAGTMFNGLGHLPLGTASLTTVSNELVVSNLVANTDFGTCVSLGDAGGGDVTLIGPDDSSLEGAELRVHAYGTLGGVPEQLLGTITAQKVGTNIQFTPDLTPVGGSSLSISVFDGPNLVGVATGVTNPTIVIPSKLRLAWLAGWKEFQHAFMRGYIHLPDRSKIELPTPTPTPPVFGTDIVIDGCFICASPLPQPPVKDVVSASFIDICASGLNSFRITQNRVGKFGQLHTAIGQAQLRGVAADLQINNLLSSANIVGSNVVDGFKLEHQWNFSGSALADVTVNALGAHWRLLNQYGQMPTGAMVRASLEGALVINGGPGSEQVLMSAQMTDLGNQKEISADFSALGATSQIVNVFSNNALVFTTFMPTGGASLQVSDWALGCGASLTNPAAGPIFGTNLLWWRFWPQAQFVVNNQLAVGDEIRIIPQNAGQVVHHLSSMSLQGAGIDTLQLVGDAPPPGPATLQIDRFGTAIALTWFREGPNQTLQCAPTLSGPWGAVPGAATPFITPLSTTNRFYRVLQQ